MRNYHRESEWEKTRYKRYQYRCPKDTAAVLDGKLKADGLTFSGWLNNKTKEYLMEDCKNKDVNGWCNFKNILCDSCGRKPVDK